MLADTTAVLGDRRRVRGVRPVRFLGPTLLLISIATSPLGAQVTVATDPDVTIVLTMLNAVAKKDISAFHSLVAANAGFAAGDVDGGLVTPELIAGFQNTCRLKDAKPSRSLPGTDAESHFVGTVWSCGDKNKNLDIVLLFEVRSGKVMGAAGISDDDFSKLNGHG